MIRRRLPFTVKEKTTKRGTCLIYSFPSHAAYLRWLREQSTHEKFE